MPWVDRSLLQALMNLISEVDLLISTVDQMPENRSARCRELLHVASVLLDDLLDQSKITIRRMSDVNINPLYQARFGEQIARSI